MKRQSAQLIIIWSMQEATSLTVASWECSIVLRGEKCGKANTHCKAEEDGMLTQIDALSSYANKCPDTLNRS